MRYGIMFRVPGEGSFFSLLTAATRGEAERRANRLNTGRDGALVAAGAMWYAARLDLCQAAHKKRALAARRAVKV